MAASAKKEYNTFVKGLVTEAGPLTFPENASLDEENCVLNREGSRQRRLGMDFEEGYVLRSATITSTTAVTVMRWENAANSPLYQLAVVQIGNQLQVFNANAVSISNNLVATLTIAGFDGSTVCVGTSGSGYLFITTGKTNPIYLQYNPSTNTVTQGSIAIRIRDLFGVDDGLAVDATPVTLSVAHDYNLRNQGWTSSLITNYFTNGGSKYPSNAMQWFVGKDTNDDFSAPLLNKQDFGTSAAPKGRIIIDAFTRSASRTAATSLSVATDTENGRPSCVAFAFERVFYSGVESSIAASSTTQPNMTGFIFYSRTIRTPADFGQCYSDADPTSEVDSELVDTDGGYINIPASGRIYALVPKGGYMLVLAEQGVWAITGDDGGFRATSNQVVKLSDFGCISNTAVVDIEDGVAYWNRGGIYAILPNDSGQLEVKNITETTIQTFYNSLSFEAKRGATGTYDPVNRRVSWLYSTDPAYSSLSFRTKYTNELVLDTTLGAFYKHKISALSDPSPYLAGFIETPNFLTRQEGVSTTMDSVTKYLVVQFVNTTTGAASFSFGFYKDIGFRDWRSLDNNGVSFVSFLETGYETAGDTVRNKQAPYLITHFKLSEREAVLVDDVIVPKVSGSCYVQSRWDWTTDSVSGKWGAKQQVYRLLRPIVLPSAPGPIDYGFGVVTNKTRLLGRGRALSLRFESEDDKDFYLYGWALSMTGNTNV